MKRTTSMRIVIALALAVAASASIALGSATKPVEFKRAELRVEINATDGDAGLQIDLDHEPWRSISIKRPDGQKILDVMNRGVLRDYGLTELFSESSEPSFEEFPLEDFQRLFPPGQYLFEGVTVEGPKMKSLVTLTHRFPAGPTITAPVEGATVPSRGLVVRWEPGPQPAGIEIVAYQVLVIPDADPKKLFSATVPASVSQIEIPMASLMVAGDYKVEVLAIEKSGNQTLTEVAFTIG
ncbi:MAG: hypothetical protein ACRDWA_02030 [Acidimicrobiia bacterium]